MPIESPENFRLGKLNEKWAQERFQSKGYLTSRTNLSPTAQLSYGDMSISLPDMPDFLIPIEVKRFPLNKRNVTLNPEYGFRFHGYYLFCQADGPNDFNERNSFLFRSTDINPIIRSLPVKCSEYVIFPLLRYFRTVGFQKLIDVKDYSWMKLPNNLSPS